MNIKKILMCMLISSLLTSCLEEKTLKIGLATQLTGIQAELGVQSRNATQIAVEELNEKGGIKGKKIDLIIKDDLGTRQGAEKAVQELIDQNVIAIIGHATSGQTICGMKVSNSAEIIMISPTSSSPELSGQDDFFFRLAASHLIRASTFAERIIKIRKISRVAVILDESNASYSVTYADNFKETFNSVGGRITTIETYSSKKKVDFSEIIQKIKDTNPDGLLIVANDFDTAVIAQHIRIKGWKIPLFSSAWAQTPTLVDYGGKAIEGMEVETLFPQDIKTPNFLDFKEKYTSRFGKNPSFGATISYETTYLLAEALSQTNKRKQGLKKALLSIKDFKGLIDNISFDEYGDVIRPYYYSTIKNGEFITTASYSLSTKKAGNE
ncbi:MAG: ABC transporter substrate-binding protein [Spirochaetales bacterium]|nr:ABC transporter substrate-binding protein [Spirochaetales bacterium]